MMSIEKCLFLSIKKEVDKSTKKPKYRTDSAFIFAIK
jgi:hypothetical protein